jgi:hypothetical protein
MNTPIQPLTSTRSCMALGLCQQRKPACAGCDHGQQFWRFAPANRPIEVMPITIDGPYHPASQVQRAQRFWLRHETSLLLAAAFILSVALVAVIGFALGYTNPVRLWSALQLWWAK